MGAKVSYVWSEVDLEADRLVRLIAAYRPRIVVIEREMIDHLGSVSVEGQKSLALLRRILSSMEKRLDKITDYLKIGGENELRAAHQLATADLTIPNDSINKLISEEAAPPIPTNKLQGTLETLLSRIVVKPRARARLF